jgi:hypothetical protein
MKSLKINTRITVPHPIEDCYGSRLHCHGCEVDELFDLETAFAVCGECRHVYQTREDLAREFLINHPDFDAYLNHGKPIAVPAAREIFFCPICIHDF